VGITGELPPIQDWPAELGTYLDWLESRGVRELLWSPEPAVLDEVAAALKGRKLALIPVLPNMPLYARDAMDSGPTGAVLKRLKVLGPLGAVGLGLRLLPKVLALFERRYAAGVLLLVEAERLRLGHLPVARVALHASAVDLALALGCRELFAEFSGRFMTNNPEFWARRMKEWDIQSLELETLVLSWKEWLPTTPRERLDAWKRRAH
jgi:hypothetical protein